MNIEFIFLRSPSPCSLQFWREWEWWR